jgi:hypothetical protein
VDNQLLNAYQRTAVTVVLNEVETGLREMLQELTSTDDGILYERTGELSPEQQQALARLVEKSLAEIATLAARFALPMQTHSARASAVGRLNVLWSNLHEIRAKRLRGYGEVAPELEAVLDPSVHRLVSLMVQMLKMLQE